MKSGIKGFTLMELLIAIAIFSIGILAVAKLHISSVGHNTNSRIYTEAASFGVGQIEELMNLPYDHIDLSYDSEDPNLRTIHPINGPVVQGIYTMDWQVTGQVTDNDLSDSNDIDMVKEIVVTVYSARSPDKTFQSPHAGYEDHFQTFQVTYYKAMSY